MHRQFRPEAAPAVATAQEAAGLATAQEAVVPVWATAVAGSALAAEAQVWVSVRAPGLRRPACLDRRTRRRRSRKPRRKARQLPPAKSDETVSNPDP